MKYTHPRSKVFFTLGWYLLFWRYSIMCGLRDDFGVEIEPGREMWLQLIPFYGAYRWWLVLKHIQGLQQQAGLGVVISPMRAFWFSTMWFGSAVYLNRHVNALYFFLQGHKLGGQAASFASMTAPVPTFRPAPPAVPAMSPVQVAPSPELPQAM